MVDVYMPCHLNAVKRAQMKAVIIRKFVKLSLVNGNCLTRKRNNRLTENIVFEHRQFLGVVVICVVGPYSEVDGNQRFGGRAASIFRVHGYTPSTLSPTQKGSCCIIRGSHGGE
jgi:hypothetical protein